MKTTEQLNELFTALVAFQSEIKIVAFDKKVTVKTKTGGSYSYEYASFSAIKTLCAPILKTHGLAVTQLLGENQLTTLLVHSSGQYIGDTMQMPINDKMAPQDIGSVITYMKRYSYSAILGLVSDEDNDGKVAGTPEEEKKDDREVLDQMSPKWEEAIGYLKKPGAKLSIIEKKYKISEEDKNELAKHTS
jgi:hypothetical protein